MRWVHVVGFIGLLLVVYGLISAIIFSNVTWYSYFVVGGTFFLGYTNYRLKNESILKVLEKNRTKVLKIYGFYLFMTIFIELIGRILFHLWKYPSFNLPEKIIHVFLIGYPFAFFFIYESFVLIRKRIQSFSFTIILATLINAFLHEIPNTFAWEWKYKIPYITFEVLQINIVIIIGWVVLIGVPLIAKKILK